MSGALLAEVPRDEPGAAERHFSTYDEAAGEAARIGTKDGLVAKVRRSPYGAGYVVLSLPVEFLLEPELKRRFIRPLDYREL